MSRPLEKIHGTNPRALGTNLRALGTNPCALGTNPKNNPENYVLVNKRWRRKIKT
jgi:hypothetical protein